MVLKLQLSRIAQTIRPNSCFHENLLDRFFRTVWLGAASEGPANMWGVSNKQKALWPHACVAVTRLVPYSFYISHCYKLKNNLPLSSFSLLDHLLWNFAIMCKVQGCLVSVAWPIKYTQFKEVTLVVIENIYFLRKGDKLENIYRESFRYL